MQKAFIRSVLIPVALLVFFAAAPAWLDHKVRDLLDAQVERSSTLSQVEKARRLNLIETFDFEKMALGKVPEQAAGLRRFLDVSGVGVQFVRLRWGFWLSLALLGLLLSGFGLVLVLSRRARRSPDDLIVAFRAAWRLSTLIALAKVVLLIPLLAYGFYEFTTLLAGRFFPQVLFVIVAGGALAIWRSAGILLRKVPLQFREPLARPVLPAEAPELWEVVRNAAKRLETAPPENILIGTRNNFYVTEFSVENDLGAVHGRTLFLSRPMMKHLSPEEVLSIVGHELGHFIGADTRTTREFYPMRFKANATLQVIARSGWVGWSSVHSLLFFSWSFDAAEKKMSRERELKADAVAARLTSAATAGRALVRFQVINEAMRVSISGPGRDKVADPYSDSLVPVVRQFLLPKEAFWNQLFEESTPHPLDSHPKLRVRLEALGQVMNVETAKACALEEGETAFGRWLGNREALFVEQASKASAEIAKAKSHAAFVEASYETEEGRKILEAHFPEVRWAVRPTFFWGPAVMVAILMAGFLAVPFLSQTLPLSGKIIIFGLTLVGAYGLNVLWRTRHKAELILRADTLFYPGWKRSLRLTNIRGFQGFLQYKRLVRVDVYLKEKEPSFGRYSPFSSKTGRVRLNLALFRGKSAEIMNTIVRYTNRQVEKQAERS